MWLRVSSYCKVVAALAVGFFIASRDAQANYIHTLNTISGADKISYWGLNEALGTNAADAWVGIDGLNNGTVSGLGASLGNAGPRPSDGFFGFSNTNNAIGFTGTTTQLLQMANAASFHGQQALTLTMWFNIPTGSATQMYYGGLSDSTFAASGRYGFGFNSNTNIRGFIRVRDAEVGPPAVLELTTDSGQNGVQSSIAPANYRNGDWHFLALTMGDNGLNKEMKIYVDGTLKFTGSIANGAGEGLSARVTSDATGVLAFGRDLGDNGDPVGRSFIGRMDEIAFIGRALSSTDIQELYQSAFTPVPEPSSMLLVCSGGLVALAVRRRRAKTNG